MQPLTYSREVVGCVIIHSFTQNSCILVCFAYLESTKASYALRKDTFLYDRLMLIT